MDGRELLRAAFFVLAGLMSGCQGTPEPAQPTALPVGAPAGPADAAGTIEIGNAPAPQPRIDWSAAGDCQAQLRLVHMAAARGGLAADARVPVAVIVHETAADRHWPISRASFVSADLPLQLRDWASAVPGEPCLIEIGPPERVEAERRTLGRAQVASAYQSGARSERNPEYDAVKTRVEQTERRLKGRKLEVLGVGDPMLDLIGILVGGVLSGFSDYGEEQELEEAMAELARTPRTLERPTWRPYTFERTVVHAAKRALVPVVLRDRARGLEWRVQLNQHEFREFNILDGLDPRDRDHEQHRAGSITHPDLEDWQRRSPELPLSSVVAALVEAPPAAATLVASAKTGGATGAGGLEAVPAGVAVSQLSTDPTDALRALKGPTPAPAAFTAPEIARAGERAGHVGELGGDPRLGSIVRVSAGGRSGAGFYIRPDLVVTTYGLTRDATVIDLTAGGQIVPGLLAASDPGRDLALVQIPKPGHPVVLAAAPAGGHSIEVLGGAGQGAVRGSLAPGGPGDLLRVHSRQLLHDGLIGAPVFLDRTVIGVLSSAVGGASEMTAVPAGAILDFVQRFAGPIAAVP